MLTTLLYIFLGCFIASAAIDVIKLACTWVLFLACLVLYDCTFLFATYDAWTGWFWDSKKGRLYVFPIPMFGFYFDFKEDPTYVM
jgi:hypothetical protein